MEQDNRESWLNRLAIGMTTLFEALGASPALPRARRDRFTSRGAKGKVIGECWDNRCSGDGHFEIFIHPDLAHAADTMPAQIAAILAHELVYAAVGIAAGHENAFKRIAVGLGLVGPMRATTPGDAFLAAVVPFLAAAGCGEITRPKKQATRMLKCECAACGYAVRTARKWLETAGAPLCSVGGGGGPMTHEPLDHADDGEEGSGS